ncbi:hypothetical protein CR513_57108, partial [Mucuna pruriens]
MKALEKNSTWEIVDRPKDKRVIGCKWIYTVKCKFDGTLERYNARLVAKGYTKTYGIDYEEKFVLVAKMNTIEKPTLKGMLATQFEMKELGKLKYFLGIEVAYSKQEAEFQAMTHDIYEGLWMNTILDELKLNSGLVVTTHVPIGLQVADVFTKGLPTTRFQELNGKVSQGLAKRIPLSRLFVESSLNEGRLLLSNLTFLSRIQENMSFRWVSTLLARQELKNT